MTVVVVLVVVEDGLSRKVKGTGTEADRGVILMSSLFASSRFQTLSLAQESESRVKFVMNSSYPGAVTTCHQR